MYWHVSPHLTSAQMTVLAVCATLYGSSSSSSCWLRLVSPGPPPPLPPYTPRSRYPIPGVWALSRMGQAMTMPMNSTHCNCFLIVSTFSSVAMSGEDLSTLRAGIL